MDQESESFLEKCIARHNHQALWQPGVAVDLKIESITGLIPTLKAVNKYLSGPCEAKVFPFDQRVIFSGLEGFSEVVYSSGDIKFKSQEYLNSLNHRSQFYGVNKLRSWSIQDIVYFFGYALVTYYSVPSMIKELEIISAGASGNFYQYKVRFPEGFDTHCSVQSFYFDKTGLLVRHDYTADVISNFSTGSHFTVNYIEKNGFLVATTRDVKLRLGKWVIPLSVLEASIS